MPFSTRQHRDCSGLLVTMLGRLDMEFVELEALMMPPPFIKPAGVFIGGKFMPLASGLMTITHKVVRPGDFST